jgi:membrane protein YdbS with pleckstrin-like domain
MTTVALDAREGIRTLRAGTGRRTLSIARTCESIAVVIWLLGVIESFIESVAAGDRSWWPFIISVVVLTAGLVAIVLWL